MRNAIITGVEGKVEVKENVYKVETAGDYLILFQRGRDLSESGQVWLNNDRVESVSIEDEASSALYNPIVKKGGRMNKKCEHSFLFTSDWWKGIIHNCESRLEVPVKCELCGLRGMKVFQFTGVVEVENSREDRWV